MISLDIEIEEELPELTDPSISSMLSGYYDGASVVKAVPSHLRVDEEMPELTDEISLPSISSILSVPSYLRVDELLVNIDWSWISELDFPVTEVELASYQLFLLSEFCCKRDSINGVEIKYFTIPPKLQCVSFHTTHAIWMQHLYRPTLYLKMHSIIFEKELKKEGLLLKDILLDHDPAKCCWCSPRDETEIIDLVSD